MKSTVVAMIEGRMVAFTAGTSGKVEMHTLGRVYDAAQIIKAAADAEIRATCERIVADLTSGVYNQ
jgi:hypothetical protein